MPLAAHGATHSGRRASNEDSLLVDPSLGLFVVADGMGGHRAGEIASDLAVETIRLALAQEPRSGDLLCDAIERANDRIFAAAARNPDHAGMGTTVSAVLVHDGEIEYVNVGDSRVYRLRNGALTQLTRDDSWLAHARANGTEISDEEAQRHPMRHVLTDVVGVRPELVPQLQVEAMTTGDVLLLCSDGLHGVVPAERLTKLLADNPDPKRAAEALVKDALDRGTTDNVSAIVVRFS